uniref:Uncharacterized protein n=1 Tax=Amphiprion percula TaxID=161767 RepID=A0A3P8TB43_AMPPE
MSFTVEKYSILPCFIWYKQYVHPPPGGSAKRCVKLLSGRRSPVLCVFPGCLRGCWCVPGNVQKACLFCQFCR